MHKGLLESEDLPCVTSHSHSPEGGVATTPLSLGRRLVMSPVLVEETCKEKMPVYFVSKVFRGAVAHYQKIEKLSLVFVVTTRKLRPYFQGQKIFFKINYHVCQVLKDPYLAGRIIYWTVELLEYDF